MQKYKQAPFAEILNNRPASDEYQSNKFKAWREAWLVATFCKSENITGLITAPYDEPVDVLLEAQNKKIQFQCVECKNHGPRGRPTDHPVETLENGMIASGVMGATNPYIDIHQRLLTSIQHKENLYDKNECQNIVLLVYGNIYWSTKEDLNITGLQTTCKNTNFKSVYIRDDGNNYFIAGQKINEII